MTDTLQPDILMQTRLTILDLLDQRGYNVQNYRSINLEELMKLMATGNDALKSNALRMEVSHKEDPNRKACVLFLFRGIKSSLTNQKFLKDELLVISDKKNENGNTSIVDSENKIIFQDVIINYPASEFYEENDTFNKAAYTAYNNTDKVLNLQFFPYGVLVSNPLKHVLQPKFEPVPKEDHEALLKALYVKKLTQLPMIKYHSDMAARCLGLRPCDIIKITASSLTSGEYVKYRVCTP